MPSPSPTPTVLGLPFELRLQITEDVLASEQIDTPELVYEHNTIGPLPALMAVCRQLFHEVGTTYFHTNKLFFHTFGELGTALLLAPATAAFWRNIHINWSGRRVLTAQGKSWQLEPGLAMLAKIPSLHHLSLDADYIVDDDYRRARRFRRCSIETCPILAQCPSKGLVIEGEITRIANQIKLALPRNHPALQSFEVCGIVKSHGTGGRKEEDGDFRRVYRLVDKKWEMENED